LGAAGESEGTRSHALARSKLSLPFFQSPLAVRDVTVTVGGAAYTATPPAALDTALVLGQEETVKVKGWRREVEGGECAGPATHPAFFFLLTLDLTHPSARPLSQIDMVVTSAGRPASPLQVGALFRHRESKATAFIPGAKRGAAGSGKHSVEVSPAGLALQLGLPPASPAAWGAFDLQVLVGDAGGADPYTWTVGRVDVSEPAAPEEGAGSPAAAPPAPTPLAALPDFDHLRRPPARQAPAGAALAFSGLMLAPLAGLALALHRLGALRLRAFPASGPALAVAGAFHACLGSGLGLALLFWVRLNLVQTLPLAGGLGVLTLAVGHRALSQHAARAAAGAAKKE